MAGKDNWRGFLDAIYSKWRLFLPILSPLLRSPTASPALLSSSPSPHLLASSHLSSPFFLFSPSASILYSDVKYGLTFPVWLRGRLPVNCKFWPTLQFIWNGKSGKAICRNRGGPLNFPPLSEFCVRPHRRIKSQGKRWYRGFSVKHNSTKLDGLRLESLLCWTV